MAEVCGVDVVVSRGIGGSVITVELMPLHQVNVRIPTYPFSTCDRQKHTEDQRKVGRKLLKCSSVKPRVMTPQSSVNFPKTHLKTAPNSAKHYKKRVLRAAFALLVRLATAASSAARFAATPIPILALEIQ